MKAVTQVVNQSSEQFFAEGFHADKEQTLKNLKIK
jgi:hypothetical protein